MVTKLTVTISFLTWSSFACGHVQHLPLFQLISVWRESTHFPLSCQKPPGVSKTSGHSFKVRGKRLKGDLSGNLRVIDFWNILREEEVESDRIVMFNSHLHLNKQGIEGYNPNAGNRFSVDGLKGQHGRGGLKYLLLCCTTRWHYKIKVLQDIQIFHGADILSKHKSHVLFACQLKNMPQQMTKLALCFASGLLQAMHNIGQCPLSQQQSQYLQFAPANCDIYNMSHQSKPKQTKAIHLWHG